LDQPGSADRYIVKTVYDDAELPAREGAAHAGRGRIGEPGHGEAIQVQRQAAGAEGNASCTGDGAGNITNELAVIRNRQSGGNGTADICGVSVVDARQERNKK